MRKFLSAAGVAGKKSKIALYIAYAVGLIVALIIPNFLTRYYVELFALICIYGILSVGFNIAYGYCGMMTFSAGAIFGVGAYTCAILMKLYSVWAPVAMLAGIVASGLVSFIISLAAYKVSGTYLTLVSYGLLEVFQRIIIESYDVTGGTSGMHISSWSLFGHVFTPNEAFYILLLVFVVVLVVQRNIYKSQWGRDFIAVKDNPIAASGMGINPARTRVIGFLIASLITGVAGVLYARHQAFLSPETFSFNTSVLILLMVLAGGKGTLSGPIVGALIIYLAPMALNDYPDAKQIFYGVMLIILIQALPKGICGIIKSRFKGVERSDVKEKHTISGDVDFSKYAVGDVSEDLLVVKNLTKVFGGLTAANDLTFTVKRGSIHALIGPNGAGKTTTINNITGVELPTSGEVYFDGKLITGKKTWDIAKLGISRTYQHVRIIPTLSVIDNVAMGARMSRRYGFFHALFSTPKKRKIDRQNYIDAYECLHLIGLDDKINEKPDKLSSGQQKLLELCRALVVKPKLMVLDEPCAGLTETETVQFAEIMKKIRAAGISMLLVEHHMKLIMDVSDTITVIDHGTKIAEGLPEAVAADPVVRRSYLGE